MNYQKLIKQLTDIGPRYAEKEIQAAQLIENWLSLLKIKFITQSFYSEVPVCEKANLKADGHEIKCLGSTMLSGKILSGDYLVSHFSNSGTTPYNIAYSPITDSISVVDHYQVPSVTISRKDVIKIIMAKNVKGEVKVKKTKINSENILVGNINNPRNIVFAHFDSIIGRGAVDNAGSVAIMMNCLANNQDLLKTTLFNFSGNEEIAYDSYKLSGYGFRVFEKQYGNLLKRANKIIVMDGLGVGKPSFTQNSLNWVLQVKMFDKIREKVFWLLNDQTQVLQYFHTLKDNDDILKLDYLLAAEELLKQKIK